MGALIALLSAVTAFAQAPTTNVAPEDPAFKFVAGYLDKSISESSGLVASRKHPGVFWTHNDSGNKPQLFAVDRTGKLLATYDVAARNVDWEDIATDDAGNLYVADIGNNARRPDRFPVVYQVAEPDPSQKPPAAPLAVTGRFPFRYAAEPFDAEALFVWKDHGYVISKQRDMGNARMFRFPLKVPKGPPPQLERVAEIPLRAPVTAADLSADGRELVVLTVFGPYRFVVNGDLATAATVRPAHVMFLQPDMEAAAVVPGGVLVTAESGHVLLFKDEMFADPKAGRAAVRQTTLELPRLAESIAVDGSVDDWRAATTAEQPLRVAPVGESSSPTAHVWAAWASDGLYVAASVPRADPRPLAAQWFTGDAVEIFVGRQVPDRDAAYGDGDERCYAGFTLGKDGQRGEAVLRWPRRATPPDGARVAGHVDAQGAYQIEAFLPAGTFGSGKELTANDALRLNVSILTGGHPRRNWFLSESNDDGTWMSPLKWAVVTLK